jgi:glycosyltransferase involved in cell wall biosynthesis
MNRLVCTNLDVPLDLPDRLPPPERRGRTRILFVSQQALGFGTLTTALERYTLTRDDVDAVHFRPSPPAWVRMAGAHRARLPRIGGTIPMTQARIALANRFFLRKWIGKRFPLERFDCVHIMTQQRALAAASMAGKGATRFVVSTDATAPAWDRAFGVGRRFPDVERRLETRVFGSMDAIACWSRWVADSLMHDFGVPASKLTLFRPCVGNAGRPPIGREPGPVRIVFVGNDWKRKGGPRLVDWHQRHWRDRAELHLCSSLAEPDRSLANVVWHGATPHERLVHEILPRMDLLAMPTWRDTYLIAAQEAQAFGLPAVTSRLAGIPEVVRHGETGFLCEPEDEDGFVGAITRLIDDAALRGRMADAARLRAERDLNPAVWNRHLVDQLIAVVESRPLCWAPAGTDAAGDPLGA